MCELCMKKAMGMKVKKRVWTVGKDTVNGSIHIYPDGDGIVIRDSWGGQPGATYVKEPNAISRLFGATIEKRIKRAERKAQALCDRENRSNNQSIRLCKKYVNIQR